MSNSDGYFPTLGPLVRKIIFSMARIGRGMSRFGRWFCGFLVRRWRPILGTACVLVAAHALSIVWFQYSIQRELKQLKSQGYIVSFKDIKREVVPDSENGAILYRKAYELLPKGNRYIILSPEQKRYRSTRQPTPSPPPYITPPSPSISMTEADLWSEAREELRDSEKALVLAMEASKRPKCYFQIVVRDGMPDLWEQTDIVRKLTNLLCAKALVEAKDGDSGEAIRSLKCALKLCPIETDGLESSTLNFAATVISRTICRVTSICKISEIQAREVSENLALITPMSAYDQERRIAPALVVGIYDAMAKQGVLQYIASDCIGEDTGRFYDSYFARPLFLGSEFQTLSLIDKMNEIDYSEIERSSVRGGPLCQLLIASLVPVSWLADRAENQIRGCRAVLALIAYKEQHGSYPDTLKALTASIKWKLNLRDIFSGKDLVYRRTGAGFILYSVGANRKDDSGAEAPGHKSGFGYDSFNDSDNYDIVWKLPS